MADIFEIGDIIIDGSGKLNKISDEYELDFIKYLPEIKLWYPRVGDFCWFINERNERDFGVIQSTGYKYIDSTGCINEVYKFTNMNLEIITGTIIEPFMNSIPALESKNCLKEKKNGN